MNQNLINFNKQLIDFLKNLKLLNIEKSKEFDIAILYLKYNKNSGMILFREYFLDDPLKRIMIFEENELFFLNKDIDYYNKNNLIQINIVSEIKSKWCSLNVENKKQIWNYLKILIYFADVEMGINTTQRNKELKYNLYSALS